MTVQELEAKKTQLEANMVAVLDASKMLVPGSAEFIECYRQYFVYQAGIDAIPAEMEALKLAEKVARLAAKHETIEAAQKKLASAITRIVGEWKLSELVEAPIVAINYVCVPSKDASGNDVMYENCVFNPQAAPAKAKGAKKSAEKGTGTKQYRGVQITAPDGTTNYGMSAFATMFLTPDELAKTKLPEGSGKLYPHTLVNKRDAFNTFCTTHNIIGYTWSTKTEREATLPPAS